MDWLRLYVDILDDRRLQRDVPAETFRRLFYEAARGAKNEMSRYVRPDNGRPPAHEWRLLRETVFRRDDFTCQRCGQRGGRLECDHIIAVARGGSHDLENLQTLCFACNRRKWAH